MPRQEILNIYVDKQKKSPHEKRFLCVMCVMYSRFMDQNSADEKKVTARK